MLGIGIAGVVLAVLGIPVMLGGYVLKSKRGTHKGLPTFVFLTGIIMVITGVLIIGSVITSITG